ERRKPPPAAATLQRLLADLDDQRLAVREKATRELEQYGELAELALEKLLAGKPDLETRRRAEKVLALVKGKGPGGADWLREPRRVEGAWPRRPPRPRKLLERGAEDDASGRGVESRAARRIFPPRKAE